VFIAVVYVVIESVRKLLDTPSYVYVRVFDCFHYCFMQWRNSLGRNTSPRHRPSR